MKRTFIAINIDTNPAIQKQLRNFQQLLRNDNVKWVETENYHITLKFLGETDEKQIPFIQEALNRIAKEYENFTLEFMGTGLFYKAGLPKVVFIKCIENQLLQNIQKEIDNSLYTFQFNKNNNFTPHLTLGRIKQIKNTMPLANQIDMSKATPVFKQQIKAFIFYESQLTTKGAIYKCLSEFPLKPKPRVL